MIVVVEVSVGRERQNLYALRLHMDEWQALVCPCTDSGDKDRDGDFKDSDVCSYLGRSSSSSASPKGTATMTALTSYRSYGSCRSVSRSTIISKAYSF